VSRRLYPAFRGFGLLQPSRCRIKDPQNRWRPLGVTRPGCSEAGRAVIADLVMPVDLPGLRYAETHVRATRKPQRHTTGVG
jgi:hypothetical protein